MSDPNWLLSTLAQSTAAVVAIVGGFLVSRLVQLSSEKEGLRRRGANAQDELRQVTKLFEAATTTDWQTAGKPSSGGWWTTW